MKSTGKGGNTLNRSPPQHGMRGHVKQHVALSFIAPLPPITSGWQMLPCMIVFAETGAHGGGGGGCGGD